MKSWGTPGICHHDAAESGQYFPFKKSSCVLKNKLNVLELTPLRYAIGQRTACGPGLPSRAVQCTFVLTAMHCTGYRMVCSNKIEQKGQRASAGMPGISFHRTYQSPRHHRPGASGSQFIKYRSADSVSALIIPGRQQLMQELLTFGGPSTRVWSQAMQEGRQHAGITPPYLVCGVDLSACVALSCSSRPLQDYQPSHPTQ